MAICGRFNAENVRVDKRGKGAGTKFGDFRVFRTLPSSLARRREGSRGF
jgi:hypothetical protein